MGERRGPEDGALLLTVLAVTSLLANAVFTRKPLPWPPDRTVWLSTLVLAASDADQLWVSSIAGEPKPGSLVQ